MRGVHLLLAELIPLNPEEPQNLNLVVLKKENLLYLFVFFVIMKDNIELKKSNNLYIYSVLLLFILPNMAWIILDRRVWPWDQAWYGQVSVELFYRLTHSRLEWAKEMISAFGIKAPGTAWLGQFFVPIGQLIGSIDIGLLLSILVTQSIVLLIIYFTIVKLTDSLLISIVCSLFVSSSPLFVGLTHQFFVEPLQTLSVSWIVLIMAFTPYWKTNRIILNLISALSLAMIAKVTSPLYFLFPIIVILYYAYKNKNMNNTLINVSSKKLLSKIKPLYITTFLLFSGFILWYGKNLQTILSFTMQASSGEASLLYGEKADFIYKIQYWSSSLQKSFFTSTSLIFILATLLYIFIKLFLKVLKNSKPIQINYFDVCTIASALEIILVLTIFSFQVNQENRYLLPIIPFLAIVISWILKKINQNIIVQFIGVLFIFQLFTVQNQAFALSAENPDISYWLYPIDVSDKNKQLLANVVSTTCSETEKERYNIIGLELPWFNANSASYFAAKQLLEKNFRCYYTSLGYAEKDTKKAWKRLFDMNINYFVVLQDDLQINQSNPFNLVSLPIMNLISQSPNFKRIVYVDNKSLLLYKHINP